MAILEQRVLKEQPAQWVLKEALVLRAILAILEKRVPKAQLGPEAIPAILATQEQPEPLVLMDTEVTVDSKARPATPATQDPPEPKAPKVPRATLDCKETRVLRAQRAQ
jgi:hypothetical protein